VRQFCLHHQRAFSGTSGTGTRDRANAAAEPFRKVIPNIAIWDAEDLDGFLDRDPSAYQAMWRDPKSIVPVPRQLPARVPNFIDREEPLGRFTEAMATDREHPLVVVVSGVAGIGKNATALEMAYRSLSSFSDGQFYVDFAKRTTTDSVLQAFLLEIGRSQADLPKVKELLPAAWRSAAWGKRVVICASNVTSAHQVNDLLTASPNCVMLVTTPEPTNDILKLADKAMFIQLGQLSAEDSYKLLVSALSAEYVAAHEPALRRISVALEGNPQSLLLLAGQLGTGKISIEAFAAEVEQVNGTKEVAVFDKVYSVLTDESRHTYRLLSTIPGGRFPVELAAAVLGRPAEQTVAALGELTQARMLQEESGQFTLSAPVPPEAGEDIAAAQRRMDLGYLSLLVTADVAITADRLRVGQTSEATRQARENGWEIGLPTSQDAWKFLSELYPDIVAWIKDAAAAGRTESIPAALEALWHETHYRRDAESIELNTIGIESARGDDLKARLLIQRADGWLAAGDREAAQRDVTEAKELAARTGNQWLVASVLEFEGIAAREAGQLEEALACFRQMFAIHDALGRDRGRGLALYQSGRTLLALERPAEAVPELRQAAAVLSEVYGDLLYARSLSALAKALVRAGEAAEATVALDQAEAIYLRDNLRRYYAEDLLTRAHLAETGQQSGVTKAGDEHTAPGQETILRERAAAIFEELGDGARAQAIRS
jgi:tetratricopeptide (TPR) repeat protein